MYAQEALNEPQLAANLVGINRSTANQESFLECDNEIYYHLFIQHVLSIIRPFRLHIILLLCNYYAFLISLYLLNKEILLYLQSIFTKTVLHMK